MKPSTKHFAVVKGPDETQMFICFSLDSARPDSYMTALEKELGKKSFRGDVLLDLLAANGESSRRFMTVRFDGEKLHWLKGKVAPAGSLDNRIVRFCQKFYASNDWALTRSVLSPAAQQRIRSSCLAEA